MIIWILWIFFVSSSFFVGARGWDWHWAYGLTSSDDHYDLDPESFLREFDYDDGTSDKIAMTDEGKSSYLARSH